MRSSIASGRRVAAAATRGALALAGACALAFASVHAQVSQPGAASGAPPTATETRPTVDTEPIAAAIAAARRASGASEPDRALAILDKALLENERDARLRFARAVVLSEARRTEAALAAFTALTEEYPELPEPHNNVATMHAARGELDLARAHLELALRARPDYALALENLGDVQLRLAERAYLRATQAEPANASARSKLTLARELIARVTLPLASIPAAPATSAPANPNPPATGPRPGNR